MDRADVSRGHLGRHLRGRLAEAVAADYFFVSGFTVLGANVRAGPLELDLVLERGDLLVVAEVRSRGAGALESALASVRWKKREQIRRATDRIWRGWLCRRLHLQRVRFDVVAVAFSGSGVLVEHVVAAFSSAG
jgi:putative endonuclease